MICPSCGSQIPDGSVFCSNCGQQVGGSGTGEPAGASPQQPAPQEPMSSQAGATTVSQPTVAQTPQPQFQQQAPYQGQPGQFQGYQQMPAQQPYQQFQQQGIPQQAQTPKKKPYAAIIAIVALAIGVIGVGFATGLFDKLLPGNGSQIPATADAPAATTDASPFTNDV